eukprot:m.165221 g.165221  ORF g.165221 m.165221 type:complete len:1386 (-) comp15231_c4_seq3:128-4285(-)
MSSRLLAHAQLAGGQPPLGYPMGIGNGGSAPAPAWALCDAFGQKFLVADSFTIGSGRCDLILPGHFDELVALIERRAPHGQHVLRDLQSRDGTFVNNARLRPELEVVLQQGDRIRFGRTMEFVWQPLKARAQPQRYQEVDIRPLADAHGAMPLMRASSRGPPEDPALPTLGLPQRAAVPQSMTRPAPRQVWGNDVYIPKAVEVEPEELFEDDGGAGRFDDRAYAPEPTDLVAARPPPAPRGARPSQVARASTVSALVTPREEAFATATPPSALPAHAQAVGALNLSPRTVPTFTLTNPPQAAVAHSNGVVRGSVPDLQPGSNALMDKDECLTMIGTQLDRMQQYATACREKDAIIAERTAELDALRTAHVLLEQQYNELNARAARVEASEASLLQDRARLEAELGRTSEALGARQTQAAEHSNKLEEHLLTISVLQKSLRESDASRAEAVRAAEAATRATQVAEAALTAAAEQHASALAGLQDEVRAARAAAEDARRNQDGAVKSMQLRLDELETTARAHTECAQRESDLAGALAAVQGGQAQLLARLGAMLTADAVATEADLVRVVDQHLSAQQARDERVRTLESTEADTRRALDQLVSDVTHLATAALPLLTVESTSVVDALRQALPSATPAAAKAREQVVPAVASIVAAAASELRAQTAATAAQMHTLTADVARLREELEQAAAGTSTAIAEGAQTAMVYARLQAAMQALVQSKPFDIGALGPDASLFTAVQAFLAARDATVESTKTERATVEENLKRQLAAARADCENERTSRIAEHAAAAQRTATLEEAAVQQQSRVNALESALAASRAEKQRVDGEADRAKAAAASLIAELTATRADVQALTETLQATRASEEAQTARVAELEAGLRAEEEAGQIKLAQLRDLEGQLSTVQTAAAATMVGAQEELSSLQSAVALMRQQRGDLQTLLAALQARIAESEDEKVLRGHEKTIAGLQRKVAELEGRLTDARAEVSDELKQQVRQLEAQLQEAQKGLQSAEEREANDRQQQAMTTATLRAQVETKSRTIASLQERIKSAGDPAAAASLAERDRAVLERRVAELEEAMQEKERLLKEKDELLAVATEGAAARAQSDEGARQNLQKKTQAEIQDLRERLASVVREREEALAQVRTLKASVASREGSLSDMQRQIQDNASGSTSTAAAAATCVTAFRDALRQIAAALDVAGAPDLPTDPVASGRIGAYQEDALHWGRHCRELVDSLAGAAANMRARVEDFPRQIKSLQSTLQAEQQQAQAAADEQVGALRTKLARREAVLESYNGDLAALTQLRAQLQASEDARGEAAREATRLKAKIEDQQRAVTKLTHELEDSRRLCEELGHRSDARTGRALSASARPSTDQLRRQMGDTRERVRRGTGDYTAAS